MNTYSTTFLLILFISISTLIHAQGIGEEIEYSSCGTPEPTAEEYQYLRNQVPVIQNYTAYQASVAGQPGYGGTPVDSIPLFFTVFRHSNGTIDVGPLGDELTVEMIDSSIALLNEDFNNTAVFNVEFYRLGDVNYVDNDVIVQFYGSYTGGPVRVGSNHIRRALNIYVSDGINISSARPPNWFEMPFPQNPNQDPATYDFTPVDNVTWEDNEVFMKPLSLFSNTFAHELGHTWGLLHTFTGASYYNNPDVNGLGHCPNEPLLDHPYDGPINGVYYNRELVIRGNVDPGDKFFFEVNCEDAGDLICDTPAACMSTVNFFPNLYPDSCSVCPITEASNSGCKSCRVLVTSETSCTYDGTYRDYNGDELIDVQDFIQNFMSYTGRCRTEFSLGQYNRMAFYHEYRKQQFNTFELNLKDTVQVAGTDVGIPLVRIGFSHPDDYRFSHTTSGHKGQIQGIINDEHVLGKVEKIALEPPTSTILPMNYTATEWHEAVNIYDAYKMACHWSNEPNCTYNDPLDGYQQLAANIDGDNVVGYNDYMLLMDFIQSPNAIFDAWESPWAFLPEYIPFENDYQFHNNPLLMSLSNGDFIVGAPYFSPDWQYELTNQHLSGGISGYDGVKIGDVDMSIAKILGNSEEPDCPDEGEVALYLPENVALQTGETVTIEIRIGSPDRIRAFQLDLFLDEEKFEIHTVLPQTILQGEENKMRIDEAQRLGDRLPLLWYTHEDEISPFDAEAPMIILELSAKQDMADISSHIRIAESAMPSLFFTEDGCTVSVQLEASIYQNSQSLQEQTNHGIATSYEVARFMCYPNPVSEGRVNIRYKSEQSTTAKIIVQNLLGQILLEEVNAIEEGFNETQLNVQNITDQVLIISILTPAGKWSQQVVKS